VSKKSPRIAIIGAGPAGCYTAQFLRKCWSAAEIIIFDRHDLPYGLIRYGVAPDHLGTKAIAKQFDRLFVRDRVEFVGNTDIGTDITLEQLRHDFDIVVLATGLWSDRIIDGFHAKGPPPLGLYGSGYLTRLINGHPGESAAQLRIGRRTIIVGNGNVAVDLVRLLLSTSDVLREHGVAEDVITALNDGPLERISVVGRSPIDAAKFDPPMIKELAKVRDVRFTTDAPISAEPSPTETAIRHIVERTETPAGRLVDFHFGWTPERVIGGDRVEGATFRSGDGRLLAIPAESLCTAVGFTETEGAVLRRDALTSISSDIDTGRLADGLYCVGWLRRGPVGTIPANRADARLVSDAIITDYESLALEDPRPQTTTRLTTS
jgi:ferredoxin--NADP+ reductase